MKTTCHLKIMRCDHCKTAQSLQKVSLGPRCKDEHAHWAIDLNYSDLPFKYCINYRASVDPVLVGRACRGAPCGAVRLSFWSQPTAVITLLVIYEKTSPLASTSRTGLLSFDMEALGIPIEATAGLPFKYYTIELEQMPHENHAKERMPRGDQLQGFHHAKDQGVCNLNVREAVL